MANFLELLQGQLDERLVDTLSQQIGGADRQQTANAAQGIMSSLVTALAKNASSPQGAESLNNALERDHDGSLLNSLSDMFSGGQIPQTQSRAANGAGIIGHLLGNNQGGVVEMVSKMSGLDTNKTGNLMTMLAPMVMGMLGQQKRQQGLDIGGIANMLSGTVNAQRQQGNPIMDMATRFLDQDGDGSAIDDIAGMVGKGLLSRLFSR
jgi:hypothetical protein